MPGPYGARRTRPPGPGPQRARSAPTVGQLPSQLDKVQQSYEDVAGALSSYESELNDVKPAFQRIAEQLGNARGALSGAQGQLANAQGNLTNAPRRTPRQGDLARGPERP